MARTLTRRNSPAPPCPLSLQLSLSRLPLLPCFAAALPKGAAQSTYDYGRSQGRYLLSCFVLDRKALARQMQQRQACAMWLHSLLGR